MVEDKRKYSKPELERIIPEDVKINDKEKPKDNKLEYFVAGIVGMGIGFGISALAIINGYSLYQYMKRILIIMVYLI